MEFFFFFYLPILTNNDLLPKIYYENIVKILCSISQLGFFILYIIFPFFIFFFLFFSLPQTCPMSYLYPPPPTLLFSFSPSFKNIPTNPALILSFFLQLSLFLFLFFFFYVIPEHSLALSAIRKEIKEI